MRDAIARKIDRVPFGYFEKTSTGDTLSRLTNDVDTLGPVSYTHLDVYKRQVHG